MAYQKVQFIVKVKKAVYSKTNEYKPHLFTCLLFIHFDFKLEYL